MSMVLFSRHTARTLALLAIVIMLSACAKSPEAKSAMYLDAGKKLLKKNDPRRAIIQFRNAVQAAPGNAEAYYQLSLAYFAVGDLQAGAGGLKKALELDPKYRPAKLRMAQFMSMASDTAYVKEAEQRFKELLEADPDDADALHALAFTELKLGDPQAAVRDLGRAMVLAPQDVMIAVSMAEAKLKQNDLAGAEEVLKKASADSPKSADAAVFLGRFYGSHNRLADAEQQFNRALSIDRNNTTALQSLAELQDGSGRKQEAEQTYKRLSGLPDPAFKPLHAIYLFQEGRRDEAIREFEALAKEDPDDREARTRLIAAYRAVQRTADVEKVLAAALKKNPKDSDALLQRGEMFMAAKKYDKAELDLNQVLHVNPDSAAARYILAKLHQARGEQRTYRQDLLSALQLDPSRLTIRLEAVQNLLATGDAKAAMSLLDNTPTAQKKLPSVLVQRNWALWMMGDLAEMRKGIDLGLSIERSPDLLVQDGVWKLRAGQSAPARESLEQALKINPGDVQALRVLNVSYVAQKQNALALQKMKEYASHEMRDAPVQEFLGVLLTASGDRKQARAAFDAAKAADPSFVQADLSLTQLDIADGKIDDAQRRLETLLSSNSSNTTVRLWLGNIETTKGNQKAALEDFRQVVTADPSNTQGLNNYAYLLSESDNQLTEALKYAQKAKELAPGDPAYSDTLGWILYRKGLYPMAVSELERAAAKGGNAVWKYHLAMAYAKAGDLNRGRTTLNAALKVNPNIPEAKMAQQLLETGKQ
jgi:tetratricopeptide (TPR) repeat protein